MLWSLYQNVVSFVWYVVQYSYPNTILYAQNPYKYNIHTAHVHTNHMINILLRYYSIYYAWIHNSHKYKMHSENMNAQECRALTATCMHII